MPSIPRTSTCGATPTARKFFSWREGLFGHQLLTDAAAEGKWFEGASLEAAEHGVDVRSLRVLRVMSKASKGPWPLWPGPFLLVVSTGVGGYSYGCSLTSCKAGTTSLPSSSTERIISL